MIEVFISIVSLTIAAFALWLSVKTRKDSDVEKRRADLVCVTKRKRDGKEYRQLIIHNNGKCVAKSVSIDIIDKGTGVSFPNYEMDMPYLNLLPGNSFALQYDVFSNSGKPEDVSVMLKWMDDFRDDRSSIQVVRFYF